MPVAPGPRVLGKKAFVTGAARGLGEAIARMLAAHGAKVFLTDIDADAVTAARAGDRRGARPRHGVFRASRRPRRGTMAVHAR